MTSQLCACGRASVLAVGLLAIAPVVVRAADQTVLGNVLLVKNPSTPEKRKITAKAKEVGTDNVLVGDPTVTGATLEMRVTGASRRAARGTPSRPGLQHVGQALLERRRDQGLHVQGLAGGERSRREGRAAQEQERGVPDQDRSRRQVPTHRRPSTHPGTGAACSSPSRGATPTVWRSRPGRSRTTVRRCSRSHDRRRRIPA